MSAARLLLLTRPDCHLCEELREELAAQFPGRIELAEACVDDRDEWRERFGTVIPVLLSPEGTVLAQTRLDPEPVRRYLDAS